MTKKRAGVPSVGLGSRTPKRQVGGLLVFFFGVCLAGSACDEKENDCEEKPAPGPLSEFCSPSAPSACADVGTFEKGLDFAIARCQDAVFGEVVTLSRCELWTIDHSWGYGGLTHRYDPSSQELLGISSFGDILTCPREREDWGQLGACEQEQCVLCGYGPDAPACDGSMAPMAVEACVAMQASLGSACAECSCNHCLPFQLSGTASTGYPELVAECLATHCPVCQSDAGVP